MLPVSAYRKAIVAAIVAFLGPVLTYLAATGDWSWRAFAGSVVSGLLGGLGTYQITNDPPGPVDEPGRHAAQL